MFVGRLPTMIKGYKVTVDLHQGYFYIKCRPGDIHGVASSAWDATIILWASNNGTCNMDDPLLQSTRDSSEFPVYPVKFIPNANADRLSVRK